YGNLEVRNAFGTIDASDVKTELADLRIDAGKIRLNGVTGRLNLEANAGEIVVEGIALNGDLKAKTDAGKISIRLNESPEAARIDLGSEVGNVRVDLEQV